mmetsp:Transcript_22947/g.38430  ORF Transcript_22947/g.38430 Transcript_22947/m.38430 type:complete len:123 (+) Transcript_22947:2895-3263(+)
MARRGGGEHGGGGGGGDDGFVPLLLGLAEWAGGRNFTATTQVHKYGRKVSSAICRESADPNPNPNPKQTSSNRLEITISITIIITVGVRCISDTSVTSARSVQHMCLAVPLSQAGVTLVDHS